MTRICLIVSVFLFSYIANGQGTTNPIVVYKIGQNDNEAFVKKLNAYQILVPGKINFITFSMYFASCPPCVTEIDTLSGRLSNWMKKGELVYSVVSAVNDSSIALGMYLKGFAAEKKWKFPIYLDTKTTLTSTLGLGNSFPVSIISDTNGMIRYTTSAGIHNNAKLDEIHNKIKELQNISYEIYDFSAAELEKMDAEWPSTERNLKADMASRGFFEKAEKQFSIISKQRDILEVQMSFPEFDGDIGHIKLKLFNEKTFLDYKKKFIDAGYILSNKYPAKNVTTYIKGKNAVSFSTENKEGFPFVVDVLVG